MSRCSILCADWRTFGFGVSNRGSSSSSSKRSSKHHSKAGHLLPTITATVQPHDANKENATLLLVNTGRHALKKVSKNRKALDEVGHHGGKQHMAVKRIKPGLAMQVPVPTPTIETGQHGTASSPEHVPSRAFSGPRSRRVAVL